MSWHSVPTCFVSSFPEVGWACSGSWGDEIGSWLHVFYGAEAECWIEMAKFVLVRRGDIDVVSIHTQMYCLPLFEHVRYRYIDIFML